MSASSHPSALPTITHAAIPPAVREALAVSSAGSPRLIKLVSAIAEELGTKTPPENVPVLMALAADMALSAWEQAPFTPHVCDVLLQVQEQYPFLPEKVLKNVRRNMASTQRDSQTLKTLAGFLKSNDVDAAKNFLATELKSTAHSMPRFALHFGLYGNDLEWLTRYLSEAGDISPMMRAMAKADILFAKEEWEKAGKEYTDLYSEASLPGLLVKAGECFLRMGERKKAATLWRQAWKMRPWATNIVLQLTDLLRNDDLPGELPEGKGAILLYSWNHARDLDLAMESLAASETGGVPILLLDNGSTDDTASVAMRWKEALGEQLRLTTLPTNVGAPAARNWLLTLPEARTADWVVYLDDDAIVPSDWLGYFGTALKAHPKAHIVGCRVVDMFAPLTLQSVDLHFECDLVSERQVGFNVTSYHEGMPDFGEFSYMRPCISVTGCCHLLTRSSLDAVGGFDLRFSPSQFDDLDRDLRSGTNGEIPLYNGHLRVGHRKRSGSAVNISAWQKANVNGNSLKVQQSHPAEAVNTLHSAALSVLEKDLAERLAML